MHRVTDRLLLIVMAGTSFCVCCSSDLPEGWEEAKELEAYVGPCVTVGSGEVQIGGRFVDGRSRVVVDGIRFNCTHNFDDIRVFKKPTSTGFDVLIQPRDLDPSTEAMCSCGHVVRFFLDTFVDRPEVRIYSRHAGDDGPNLKAEIVMDEQSTDCGTLNSCAAHDDCPAPEDPGEVEPFVGSNACTKFCAWLGEACFMECRNQECTRSDSLPGVLACD